MSTVRIAFNERDTLVEGVVHRVGVPFDCPAQWAREFLKNGVAREVIQFAQPKEESQVEAPVEPKPEPRKVPERRRRRRRGKAALPPAASEVRQSIMEVVPRPDAKVAILIPALNPREFLEPCLKSLAMSDAANISEVIFVDNGSDPPCAKDALELMVHHGLAGRVIRLEENINPAPAVQLASEYAAGEFLVCLNVDTILTPKFFAPMMEVMERDPQIAIVGNLHKKPGGEIDSAGSVWSWDSGSYQHRGRDAPADTSYEIELDMVTFACVLMRRSVWDEIGGADTEAYKAPYWVDGDICMKARRKGYRVFYTPKSEITHHLGHATKGTDLSLVHTINRPCFYRRWVHSGLVEEFARRRGSRCAEMRVVVGMIVLNEEEYVCAALDSVYQDADLIVVPVGAVDYARQAGMCKEDGSPTDSTLELLQAYPDPEDKLRIVGPQLWPDKRDMRNAILRECQEGDMVVMMDGDEVAYPHALWRAFAQLIMRPGHSVAPLREDHWNDFWTIATGPWEDVQEHRIFRYRAGMRYEIHHTPTPTPQKLCVDYPVWAHYACVKPVAKIREKAHYYECYPPTANHVIKDYVDAVFLQWRKNPEMIERTIGTHLLGRGGGTKPYTRRHPPQIERLLLSGVMPGADW